MYSNKRNHPLALQGKAAESVSVVVVVLMIIAAALCAMVSA